MGGSAQGPDRRAARRGPGASGCAPASAASTRRSSSREGGRVRAGLPDPRVTSDAKHVEIGLTDKADSARWLFGELGRRGVGPGLVLVAGDEFGPLGGLPGSDSFLLVPRAARDGGLGRRGADRRPRRRDRARRRPGGVRRAPRGPARARSPATRPSSTATRAGRSRPTRTTPCSSASATRCSRSPTAGSARATDACSQPGSTTARAPRRRCWRCPVWQRLGPADRRDRAAARRLDLRTGVLEDELRPATAARCARRCSRRSRVPGRSRARASGRRLGARRGRPSCRRAAAPTSSSAREAPLWIRAVAATGGGVVAAARSGDARAGTLERLAAYHVDPLDGPDERRAGARSPRSSAPATSACSPSIARRGRAVGGADVVVEGDPELQLAVRSRSST